MKYCQYKSSNCHSARSGCLLVFLNICSFRMFIDHVWLRFKDNAAFRAKTIIVKFCSTIFALHIISSQSFRKIQIPS